MTLKLLLLKPWKVFYLQLNWPVFLSVSAGCKVCGGEEEAAAGLPSHGDEQTDPDAARVHSSPYQRGSAGSAAFLSVSGHTQACSMWQPSVCVSVCACAWTRNRCHCGERERAREVQSSCSLWKTNLCGGNVLNSLFFVEKNTTVIETLNYSTLRTFESCYMPLQKSLKQICINTLQSAIFSVACPSCCGSNCSKIQTLKQLKITCKPTNKLLLAFTRSAYIFTHTHFQTLLRRVWKCTKSCLLPI